MVPKMSDFSRKKAYIKCRNCDEVYFTGVLVDAVGMVHLENGHDRPKVCPLCGDPNTKTQCIELRSIAKMAQNVNNNDTILNPCNLKKARLKVKCSACQALRDTSGRCWNCDASIPDEHQESHARSESINGPHSTGQTTLM